jgi:hypothetical protein
MIEYRVVVLDQENVADRVHRVIVNVVRVRVPTIDIDERKIHVNVHVLIHVLVNDILVMKQVEKRKNLDVKILH